MSGKSSIEWTNATWNPVTGCSRVSAGCDACYAFALHDRRHACYVANEGRWSANGPVMPKQYALPFSTIQLHPDRLGWPLKEHKPLRVFVNSMSDLFHTQVPDDYIRQVFATMRAADWHIFQILTKRPGRLRRLANDLVWAPNIWIGVSIETDRFVRRADALRQVPAAVRFLSCEPLLGPLPSLDLKGIHWVITGGESGPQARPCHADWIRGLRDRCQQAHVAFFHKQWGGRTPKAGGRLLDGRTWDEFPQVSRQETLFD